MLGRRAVADDQGGTAGPPGGAVRAERFDGEAMRGGPGDHVVLALSGWQFEQRVQAGGDARDAYVRGLPPERRGQAVSPPPVGEP